MLIVSDGLRWQEIFTGADPLLLNEENGGIWDKESDLRRDFWRDSAEERRQALFPFLWGTVAAHGQIFGNQTKGSIAHVTNGMAFSYPGYNEMLSGHPDPRIDSNEFGPNPEPDRVRVAQRPARSARTGQRLRDLEHLQGHLQRGAQPPAAACRLGRALHAASSRRAKNS